MSDERCSQVQDLLPELALGIVGARDRADLLAHTTRCAPCQAALAQHATVADALLHLVRDAEPPPRFETRFAEQLRAARTTRPRRRLAAAVLVLVLAVGAAVAIAFVHGRAATERSASPPLRVAAMRTVAGTAVGSAVVAGDPPSALAVSVDYLVPDGSYGVEIRPRSGRDVRIGTLDVRAGHGTWSDTTRVSARATAVALVDARGRTVCGARLPPIRA